MNYCVDNGQCLNQRQDTISESLKTKKLLGEIRIIQGLRYTKVKDMKVELLFIFFIVYMFHHVLLDLCFTFMTACKHTINNTNEITKVNDNFTVCRFPFLHMHINQTFPFAQAEVRIAHCNLCVNLCTHEMYTHE